MSAARPELFALESKANPGEFLRWSDATMRDHTPRAFARHSSLILFESGADAEEISQKLAAKDGQDCQVVRFVMVNEEQPAPCPAWVVRPSGRVCPSCEYPVKTQGKETTCGECGLHLVAPGAAS